MYDNDSMRRGMPWPKTGATLYNVYLGIPHKGRTIIGVVVCYMVWLEYLKVNGGAN